jgi:hypothetical protein
VLWRAPGVHTLASGTLGTSLGTCELAVAVRLLAVGLHERDEESQREVQDMLMHARWERRGEWHGEEWHAHGMVMSMMNSCSIFVSGVWQCQLGARRSW